MPGLDPKLIPVGLPWCREEDYDSFLAIFKDPNDLPKSWDNFVARMEKAERSYQDSGQLVRRIYINPRTFPIWCERNGHRVNPDTCYKFAAEIAVKEQRNAGGRW